MFGKEQDDSKSKKVVVIGAGIAGCLSAYLLSKEKNEDGLPRYHIILVDPGESILPACSTSRNQCFKLHTGLHYAGSELDLKTGRPADFRTANQCLYSTILLAQEFPNCIIKDAPSGNYVMSGSLYTRAEVEAICEELLNTYSQLVFKDSGNQVLGKVEDFLRYIKPEEMHPALSREVLVDDEKGRSHKESILIGIQTPEFHLDMDRLAKELTEYFEQTENVSILTEHRIDPENITLLDGNCYEVCPYNIKTQQTGEPIFANAMVNAAWQNAQKITRALFSSEEDAPRELIRVKGTIVLSLPEGMEDFSSFTGIVGPYATVVKHKDKLICAYENETNIGFFYSGEEPLEALKPYMSPELTHKSGAGKALAEAIRAGCARYVPQLAKVPIESLNIGYVVMDDGYVNIYDRYSDIHKRLEMGVWLVPGSLTFFQVEARKMVYALSSAMILRDQLNFVMDYLAIQQQTENKKEVESILHQGKKEVHDTMQGVSPETERKGGRFLSQLFTPAKDEGEDETEEPVPSLLRLTMRRWLSLLAEG